MGGVGQAIERFRSAARRGVHRLPRGRAWAGPPRMPARSALRRTVRAVMNGTQQQTAEESARAHVARYLRRHLDKIFSGKASIAIPEDERVVRTPSFSPSQLKRAAERFRQSQRPLFIIAARLSHKLNARAVWRRPSNRSGLRFTCREWRAGCSAKII